jgi:hypothetical protein
MPSGRSPEFFVRPPPRAQITTPAATPRAEVIDVLWVMTNRRDRLSPRCLRAKAIAAGRRFTAGQRIDTRFQPVLPSISVMLAMSNPRSWDNAFRHPERTGRIPRVENGVPPEAVD